MRRTYAVLISGLLSALLLAGFWWWDSTIATTLLWIIFIPFIISLLSGILKGILINQWDTFRFAINIFKGNFISEPGHTILKGVGVIMSRLYWQQPQTIIGNVGMHVLNSVWLIRRTDVYKDTLICQGSFLYGGGIALGSFLMIDLQTSPVVDILPMDDRTVPERVLLRHEYGHYLQSISSGPLFIFKYGLPSIIVQGWTEPDADYRSDKELLLSEQIMPVFNNHRNQHESINPKWWEYILVMIFTAGGAYVNSFHGALGSTIIGLVIITALNMKKPA